MTVFEQLRQQGIHDPEVGLNIVFSRALAKVLTDMGREDVLERMPRLEDGNVCERLAAKYMKEERT